MLVKVLCLLLLSLSMLGCARTPSPAVQANLPNPYDRRPGVVAFKDEQIEINARNLINADENLAMHSHVNVHAFNGKILVTGEVSDEQQHHALIEQLRNLPEVTQVNDELDISAVLDPSVYVLDSTITNRVRTELDKITELNGFNPNNIKVITEAGVVYLLGLVYRDEADVVTRVVQQVEGVQQLVKMFEYFKENY